MFLLFTTPSCHQCPRAKTFLLEKKITATAVDASRPEGLQMARKYGISAVPTLVEVDAEEKAISSISGLENIIQTFS